MIYIRDLFPAIPSLVKVLSYINDISLTTSLTSFKKNVLALKREVAKIYELGAKNAIEFDLAKIELIHFNKSK